MKKVIVLAALLCIVHIQAKKDTCLLQALLMTSRSIQNSSSEILGKVCTIEDVTIELLRKICIFLDITIGCNATPISMPTTITESGPYCLAQSITGDITIAADGVVLDLNSHKLFGGISVSNQSGVVVKNGFIGATATGCVMFSDCTKVEVTGVLFSDSAVGISITNTDLVVLRECKFVGQTSFAVTTTLTSNMELKDLKASQCGTAFSIAAGNTIGVISCEAVESTGNGFLFDSASALQLIDCTSNESANNAFSFINSCTDAQIFNCIGSRSGGGDGYLLDGASSFQLTNCQATSNFARGFNVSSSNSINIDCGNANLNTGRGYSFSEVNNINISNSNAGFNGGEGYDFEGCNNINIQDSVASNNTTNGGFHFFNCRSIEVAGSFATQNTGNGFLIDGSSAITITENVLFINNLASRNTLVGFRAVFAIAGVLAARFVFDNCVSERNGDGFEILRPITLVLTGADFAVSHCKAINNTGDGFILGGGAGGGIPRGNFIGNIAVGNSATGFTAGGATSYYAVNNYSVNNGGLSFAGVAFTGPGPIAAGSLLTTDGFWTNVS